MQRQSAIKLVVIGMGVASVLILAPLPPVPIKPAQADDVWWAMAVARQSTVPYQNSGQDRAMIQITSPNGVNYAWRGVYTKGALGSDSLVIGGNANTWDNVNSVWVDTGTFPADGPDFLRLSRYTGANCQLTARDRAIQDACGNPTGRYMYINWMGGIVYDSLGEVSFAYQYYTVGGYWPAWYDNIMLVPVP